MPNNAMPGRIQLSPANPGCGTATDGHPRIPGELAMLTAPSNFSAIERKHCNCSSVDEFSSSSALDKCVIRRTSLTPAIEWSRCSRSVASRGENPRRFIPVSNLSQTGSAAPEIESSNSICSEQCTTNSNCHCIAARNSSLSSAPESSTIGTVMPFSRRQIAS